MRKRAKKAAPARKRPAPAGAQVRAVSRPIEPPVFVIYGVPFFRKDVAAAKGDMREYVWRRVKRMIEEAHRTDP